MNTGKFLRACLFLATGLGIGLAPPAATATPVGAIPGQFAVSETGAATYSIPINVAPGVAGLEPKLALTYNSQGGLGPLGRGWSITGLSSITRCPKTLAQDGVITGVNFTATDRFCLDGQRLVATTGTYGADGTEYRTELETYSKVVSYGTSGTGPAYFKVWTKSGLVMEFGNTADAKKYGTGTTVRLWGVNKVSDTSGNYMKVSYYGATLSNLPPELITDGNTYLYPIRVEYSGNSTAGTATNNYVDFLYSNIVPDVFESPYYYFSPAYPMPTVYQAGAGVSVGSYLHSIYSWSNGQQVYWYDLHYEGEAPIPAATSRGRLKTIKHCGKENGAWSCLADTVLGWQDSPVSFDFGKNLPGASTATNSNIDSTQKNIISGDWNGDGKTDFLHLHPNADPKYSWVALSNGDGTFQFMNSLPGASTTTNSYLSTINNTVITGDFDGDGKTDLLHLDHNADPKYSWVALSNGDGTFRFLKTLPGASVTTNSYRSLGDGKILAGDFNGDGRTDLLHLHQDPDPAYSWVALSNGDGTFVFSRSLPGSSYETMTYLDSYSSDIVLGDFNGDGRMDLLHLHPSIGATMSWVGLSNGNGTFSFSNSLPGAWAYLHSYIDSSNKLIVPGDINGDGKTDLFHLHPNSSSSYSWVAISKGDGTFIFQSSLPGATTANYAYLTTSNDDVIAGDFNGDGWTDFAHLQPNADPKYSWVATSHGNGYFSFSNAFPGASTATDSYLTSTDRLVLTGDFNGDGKTDLFHLHPNTDPQYSWTAMTGQPSPILMTSITNGLGVETSLSYKPITDTSVHEKSSGAVFPDLDLAAPIYVVSQVIADNGIGGTSTVSYTYEGARAHLQGRGFLGFQAVTAVDAQTGIETRTEYAQTFPYAGLPLTVTKTLNGTVIGRTTTTYANKTLTGPRYFPYAQSVVEEVFDLGGSLLNKVTTTNTYDDWGNPLTIDALNADGHRKYTVNTYTNTASTWILGRLTRATVTSTLPNASSATRVSAFTYDSVTGLLTKETIEPDSTTLKLDTSYLYDSFGNRKTVTQSTTATGTGAFTSRSTTTTYDALGQFPLTVSNPLNQAESRTYDGRFGKLASLTGPNNLTTTWAYDGFGRKTLETRADGTTTAWAYVECTSGCTAYGKYYVSEIATGAPEKRVYYDALNREVRSAHIGFDGRWVYVDTEYDLNGRVYRVSRPYYSGDAVYWTTTFYDALGRPYQISDADGTTSIAYSGLSTTTTNPKGQTRTEVKNSQGRLVSVTDHLGWMVSYTHDPFGNLLTTVDPNGNTLVNTYDIRGRKLSMLDPDMGYWTYEYNALGELVKQTNARQQVTSHTYDLLGRLVTRTESDLISNWYYDKYKDGSACAMGVGKLCEISADNNTGQKTYYDSYGRVAVMTHTIDATYSAYRTYDSAGRADTQSVNAVFATRNVYNAQGYLSEVRRDSDNSLLWRADTRDAEGRVTKQTYGNGVVTDRVYNAQNGRLTSILANGPNGAVQNQTYAYDSLGNLQSRADGVLGTSENFLYDGLNRLTSATQGATTVTVSYNALGNITNKSDVGAYTYGPRPHAVTQAGANAYTYDADGNQLTGAGRSLTWSSYDLPTQIVEASGTTGFIYNYDHVRVKQTSPGKTVVYLNPRIDLGGHYHKETTGSVVTESFYFYAGGQVVGAYVTQTNASPKTNYFHADHLGSISVVTDSAGAVVARYSFDAWGKRVLAAGSSATIHGFTGHEHLDDGLIHMNGRVYDPVLGRFLSADPMIQAPDNLQSFNRYSYVLNNPLFYTDPSGYSWFSKLFRTVVSIAIMVYAPGLLQTYASLSPVAANLTAGFLSGAVGSGSLQGGVMGVLSAGMFMGIGSSIPDWGLMKVAAHGIAGGMMSVMQGGDFGAGFLSGGFTQAFAPAIDGIDPSTYGPSMQRTIAAAVVGGTGSVIGGGKFANGAITGAFSRLFNDDNHARQFGHPLTLKRFEPIIQAANINLAANMEKASKMSFIEWVDAVRTGGDWDYKNNKNVIDAGISPSLRDEFGNFHFGMTAAARGYSLGFTLTGAGSYQTFFQGSKSAGGWNPFAAAYPNAVADIMSTHGFRFGDNPGDSMAIRNGWRYYNGE